MGDSSNPQDVFLLVCKLVRVGSVGPNGSAHSASDSAWSGRKALACKLGLGLVLVPSAAHSVSVWLGLHLGWVSLPGSRPSSGMDDWVT